MAGADQRNPMAGSASAQVAASRQILAALAGLCTAGPLGALASLAAIRGLQGKWSTWFLLGVPAAITINGLYAGLFFGALALMNRTVPQPQARASAPPAALNPTPSVRASMPEPGLYHAGTAIAGQQVVVDLASIRQGAQAGAVEFVYYLGSERIVSTADCAAGSWLTRPDMTTHRPQSAATQNMLDRVCQVGGRTAGMPSR